ncbi:EamA family transporter [Methylocella sp.]|uniref:EamA family transporter n=1 Tax=Methylocella sp. TaxID=1978226 RepID=UPI0035B4CE03
MSAGAGWLPFALASAGFAALTAIFAKIGVEAIDSNLATFVRTLFVVVLLGAVVAASGAARGIGAIPARSWLFLALSAAATGASWACYFHALQLGPASRVAPIDKLSVAMVALFGALFLGERLAPAGWLGVAFIVAGALLVAFSK